MTNTASVSGGGETNTANDTASDVTVIAMPDTEPPSAPGVLTAVAPNGTHVDLSWGPATDNVGVTDYRVERCDGVCTDVGFVKIAAPTGTTFSDSGLTPNTTYSYIVRAEDGASNLGPYSNVVDGDHIVHDSRTRRRVCVRRRDRDDGDRSVRQRPHRDDRERDVDDSGKYGQGVAVQRNEREGQHSGCGVAPPDDGDDAGSVGQSVRGDERLARRDLQGQRQLLSDGNHRSRWPAGRWRDVRRNERQSVWDLDTPSQHVDPSGNDLRRGNAAPVCERDAGGERATNRSADGFDQSAGDRRRQHLRAVSSRV